jgi:hypothetical protein
VLQELLGVEQTVLESLAGRAVIFEQTLDELDNCVSGV